MPKTNITIIGWECLRCSHKWKPREEVKEDNKPISCPKCKSPYWDKEKKKK